MTTPSREPDSIDLEIAALEQHWAEQGASRESRAQEARRKRMEERRERFRSGAWKPWHYCRQCARAILTLDPSLVCEQGRHFEQWWV
jgi:hypothetical protein